MTCTNPAKLRCLLIKNRTAFIFCSHPKLLHIGIPIQAMNPLALYALRMIIRYINRKVPGTTTLIIQPSVESTNPDAFLFINIHISNCITAKRV